MTFAPLSTRNLAILAMAPLALGLAACNKSEGGASAPAGSVAAVAPPAGKQWTETFTKTEDGDGVIVGNPNAPIKMVEYGSLSCPIAQNWRRTE
jgi:protein-disulfide isomerase